MLQSQLISSVLVIQNNIRIHHWMSDSLNQHKILGDLYDAVGEPLDMIVEVQSLEDGDDRTGDSISMRMTVGKVSMPDSMEMINECIEILTRLEPELSRSTKAAVDLLHELFAKAKYKLKLEMNSAYNSPA